MKLLFLTRRFYPMLGGVEKHCLEVGKRLVKKGNEVTVVTEEDSIKKKVLSIKEGDEKDGIKIFRIPITVGERLKKFQIWQWFWKNKHLIEEADIVHCHDVFFWILPFRFLYPRKKFFITFHGWEGKFPPPLKTILLRKLFEKLARGNICVGDYVPKWYKTKADFITYGGIGQVQSAKRKDQNHKSKFKIIFTGRLADDTGLPIYLKVLEILRSKGFVGEVEFAGDGMLRKEAEKYGKVLGFVSDVENYIRDSDLVFASGYLSILEAMSERKLVFSTYDNALKEDTLRLSPFSELIIIEDNSEKMADKVQYYFSNLEKRKKMEEKAYNWARKQTWEKVTEIYLKLWGKGCSKLSNP